MHVNHTVSRGQVRPGLCRKVENGMASAGSNVSRRLTEGIEHLPRRKAVNCAQDDGSCSCNLRRGGRGPRSQRPTVGWKRPVAVKIRWRIWLTIKLIDLG